MGKEGKIKRIEKKKKQKNNFFYVLEFDSIVVGQRNLCDYDSFKFVEVCCVALDVVYLDVFSVGTRKECVFCCHWVKFSMNVDQPSWWMVL